MDVAKQHTAWTGNVMFAGILFFIPSAIWFYGSILLNNGYLAFFPVVGYFAFVVFTGICINFFKAAAWILRQMKK